MVRVTNLTPGSDAPNPRLMLVGQGALAVAVFVKSDFVKMPEDITGNEAKAWSLVHKNLPVVGLHKLCTQLRDP